VFKISRDKRLHSQPLQSRNGKTASGAKSTGNPIVSFANTVDTVFYTDTDTEETAYVVFCDQPEDLAGQMPSGPSKVGSCFIMPYDQVQRLKAVLNYHPLSKSEDPEQRELYNFQKVLDQFLNDEDYVSGHKTPFGVELFIDYLERGGLLGDEGPIFWPEPEYYVRPTELTTVLESLNRWECQRLSQEGAQMEELWETFNKIRSICIHSKLNLDELYSIGIDGLPSTDDEDLPQPVRNWVHGKSTKGKSECPVQSKGQA
jgi:hypothetical protein